MNFTTKYKIDQLMITSLMKVLIHKRIELVVLEPLLLMVELVMPHIVHWLVISLLQVDFQSLLRANKL